MRSRAPVLSFVAAAVLASPLAAAQRDVMAQVAETAARCAKESGPLAWETAVDFDAADLIEFLSPERVLVGAVSSDSKLGIVRHGPLLLYDARTGALLWKAPRAGGAGAQFHVLSAQPAVVVVGTESDKLTLLALDPDTGKERWTFRAPYPCRLLPAADRILALSSRDRTLRAIDGGTGKVVWSRTFDADVVPPDRAAHLAEVGDGVVVLGRRAVALALSDGSQRWQVDHPSMAQETVALPLSEGLALWNAEHLTVLDPATGAARWSRAESRAGTKGAAAAPGLVLRVLIRAEGGGDVVEALDAKSGALRWTAVCEGTVVSPLVTDRGRVFFTTDGLAWARRASDGGRIFRTDLGPVLASSSPGLAGPGALPDALVLRGDRLCVLRGRAGAFALSVPQGTLAWTQVHFAGPGASPADVALSVTGSGVLSGGGPAKTATAPRPLTAPGPNTFLVAAEQRHAEAVARTARTMAREDATDLERRNARLGLDLSASDVMNQQRITMAFSQAQAAADLGLSLISMAQAHRQRMKQLALSAMQDRVSMMLHSAVRGRAEALQGRFVVLAFEKAFTGFGVTLVDLETGLRSDLLVSALVAPVLDFGVVLFTHSVSPGGTRLLTVGVPLDAARHRPTRKWNWTFPGPSLMAYDLSKLPYAEKSRLERPAPAAPAVVPVVPAVSGPAVPPALQALHEGIDRGNLIQVRTALDQGADPSGAFGGQTPLNRAIAAGQSALAGVLIERGANLKQPGLGKATPLMLAAMKLDLELMKKCLAGGAEVDARNANDETPLLHLINSSYWFIHGKKMLPVVELLLKSGADPNLTCLIGKPMLAFAERQNRGLGDLLRRYGAKK